MLMTSKFEDPITVQSVSQTTAGEYREWTITVRDGSARAHAVPAGCVPTAVHEAICDWLDVPRPREAQAATATPEEPTQPQDDVPVMVRVPAGTEPARPVRFPSAVARDHENAIQRQEPNPNLLTLWNNTFTEHTDVLASVLTHRGNLRLRIHFGHRGTVQAFVRDHDGDLRARWRGGTWRVRSISAPRGHLDVELEETRAASEHIEAPKPPYSLDDLAAMKDKITADYLASRTNSKTTCPGCTNPTEHGHYPWCPHATDANLYRAPRADRIYREPEPAPEAYTLPDGVGLGTVPEYGQPVAREQDRCDYRLLGARCTLTAGHSQLIHEMDGPGDLSIDAEEVKLPNPLPPSPEQELTNDYPEPDVDEVLPMPGGPNDRLAQAPKRLCRAKHPVSLNACLEPAGHRGPHSAWPGDTWPVGEVVTGPYADLYARIESIHDATADEDDQ